MFGDHLRSTAASTGDIGTRRVVRIDWFRFRS